jgi:hypothetical protein
MNYFDKIVASLGKKLDDCPPELLRQYALLVLIKGRKCTLKDVHDAWAAWRTVTKPDHKDLVPFRELTPQARELDRKYRDAIVAVARELK